jgi:transcription initiation factor TFIID subunit 5
LLLEFSSLISITRISFEYLPKDSTRAELSQLLYPVFAHTYIKLLVNNYDIEARNFYNEFAKGFGEDSPYIEDIRRLATVTNKKQLAQNDVITTFKVRHFIIRMTRDSLLSLKRHINDRNIQVLIDILEDHLFIDQFDGLPRTREQIDAVSGGLLGEAKRDANKVLKLLILMLIFSVKNPTWSSAGARSRRN